VHDLSTRFFTSAGPVSAVEGVNLTIDAGERVGLVGESGCGKTVLALSMLGLVPEPGRVTSGRVVFRGRDVLEMDDESLRRLRGGDLAMSFQDPATALNPLMRVRAQIREAMVAHDRFGPADADRRVVPLLGRVAIPGAPDRAGDHPHQFSGGMRQRVVMAMGLANEPGLLITDEPTTALDAVNQAQVMALLGDVNAELGTAVLLITHNLALVAGFCDRVIVMYAGRVVEEGPVGQIFARPQHPYTWSLLRCLPRLDTDTTGGLPPMSGSPPDLAALPPGCTFHPRCPFVEPRCREEEPVLADAGQGQRARCFVRMSNVDHHRRAADRATDRPTDRAPGRGGPARATSRTAVTPSPVPAPGRAANPMLAVHGLSKQFPSVAGVIRAVDGVTFAIDPGETLALIGQSGCGKTTLARLVTRLMPATSGTVSFEGEELTTMSAKRLRSVRPRLQMVFQDPRSSLDPRMTVGAILAEPLANVGVPRAARAGRARELLDLVGLPRTVAGRRPHELSGGQCQRVGIARALATGPSFMVCDEPVSALDVSIQAQILELLAELRARLGLTCLFISHDLAVVAHVADRVAVMCQGRLVEVAAVADVFARPRHPYTRALLDAVPLIAHHVADS